MNKQIEMTDMTQRDDIHQSEYSQPKDQTKSTAGSNSQGKRIHQPLPLYILSVLCQLITIFMSLLLAIYPQPQDKQYVYLTFIILTPIRAGIFLLNSIKTIGWTKRLAKLYFLLDNTFLMQVASVITYTFLNYKIQIPYATGALICYPFLLFFLVGNFRVMLKYSRWHPSQVIIYKMVKIIGSTYFLIYGTLLIIKSPDSDLFMLWVFTTCGFWAEMCFCINSFDQSDGLSTKYRLIED